MKFGKTTIVLSISKVYLYIERWPDSGHEAFFQRNVHISTGALQTHVKYILVIMDAKTLVQNCFFQVLTRRAQKVPRVWYEINKT